MDTSLHRRISVSTLWASTRIALLDSHENYEDSYALTQEFREWITCVGEEPELLEMSSQKVPEFTKESQLDHQNDADEMLEI